MNDSGKIAINDIVIEIMDKAGPEAGCAIFLIAKLLEIFKEKGLLNDDDFQSLMCFMDAIGELGRQELAKMEDNP